MTTATGAVAMRPVPVPRGRAFCVAIVRLIKRAAMLILDPLTGQTVEIPRPRPRPKAV